MNPETQLAPLENGTATADTKRFPRRRGSFRQFEIVRALKAATRAGFNVTRVDIGIHGELTLELAAAPAQLSIKSPLDEWKRKRDARQA